MPLGHTLGKEQARGRCRDNPGLTPNLGGAIALACEDGGHGGIIGLHDFTGAELLAWREPPRLLPDALLGLPGCVQGTGPPLPLGVLEVVGLGTMLLRLRAKRGDGLAECQELPCGLAHPRHEDAALPPAAAAKTSHALVQLWLETVGLT